MAGTTDVNGSDDGAAESTEVGTADGDDGTPESTEARAADKNDSEMEMAENTQENSLIITLFVKSPATMWKKLE